MCSVHKCNVSSFMYGLYMDGGATEEHRGSKEAKETGKQGAKRKIVRELDKQVNGQAPAQERAEVDIDGMGTGSRTSRAAVRAATAATAKKNNNNDDQQQ